jgi:GTPase SAR1 family protein
MIKKLIPIGQHCNITYSLQKLGLKKETSLFEWFESDSLTSVTKIINLIKNNIDTNIVCGQDYKIFLLHNNSDIYTFHYTVVEYKEIFKRRVERFINDIKNENEILFVRINSYTISTSKKEIEDFIESIKSINPELNIKFLLIDTIDKQENFNEIKENNIIHKYFLHSNQKNIYLHDEPIIHKQLYEYLKDVGYDMQGVNIVFNDRSMI